MSGEPHDGASFDAATAGRFPTADWKARRLLEQCAMGNVAIASKDEQRAHDYD
jgi:hypothetical protein